MAVCGYLYVPGLYITFSADQPVAAWRFTALFIIFGGKYFDFRYQFPLRDSFPRIA